MGRDKNFLSTSADDQNFQKNLEGDMHRELQKKSGGGMWTGK